jgi:hypothetical protein
MPHSIACERVPLARIKHIVPDHYREALEHNQKLASCCRDTEHHEIEALYSSDADKAKGVPDIYILHCTCGRMHRRFCVGGGDARPFWDRR